MRLFCLLLRIARFHILRCCQGHHAPLVVHGTVHPRLVSVLLNISHFHSDRIRSEQHPPMLANRLVEFQLARHSPADNLVCERPLKSAAGGG